MIDASWVIEGKRLRLGDHEYVLAEDFDRIQRSLIELDKRHRNLRQNYLMHQLKLGRKLAKKERRLMVNHWKGNYEIT